METPKTYANCLQDRLDAVIKQSQERRKEFEDFMAAVVKRADIEENYHKGLEAAARQLERYTNGTTSSSLAFAALKSDQMHRVQQSKVFVQSVRDDILTMLRDLSTQQLNDCKKYDKETRRLEKELFSHHDNLMKAKNRFLQSQRNYEEESMTNEVVKVLVQFGKDKKEKHQARFKDSEKEMREYEQTYRLAIRQYNDYLAMFHNEMDKYLAKYEQHERSRIDKQVDAVMKMLVFQSGMMKNFDYDIGSVSKQVNSANPQQDIEQFITQNSTNKGRAISEQFHCSTRMISKAVQNLLNKHTYSRADFQRKKETKDFVEACFKGNTKEVIPTLENKSEELSQLAQIIDDCWKGNIMEEPEKLSKICDDQNIRHIFVLLHRYYGGMNNLQLSPTSFQTSRRQIQIVLDKCLQYQDILVARKLLNIIFSQYSVPGQQNMEKSMDRQQKQELYIALSGHPLWRIADFWEAAILQSIQEELKSIVSQRETLQESLDREKNIIFSQLAAFCHNMVMLGLPSMPVRTIAGKYFQLYNLEEEKLKHLSDTLRNSFKKYKQMTGQKEQEESEDYRRMSS